MRRAASVPRQVDTAREHQIAADGHPKGEHTDRDAEDDQQRPAPVLPEVPPDLSDRNGHRLFQD